jgi:hypothetical protein
MMTFNDKKWIADQNDGARVSSRRWISFLEKIVQPQSGKAVPRRNEIQGNKSTNERALLWRENIIASEE